MEQKQTFDGLEIALSEAVVADLAETIVLHGGTKLIIHVSFLKLIKHIWTIVELNLLINMICYRWE